MFSDGIEPLSFEAPADDKPPSLAVHLRCWRASLGFAISRKEPGYRWAVAFLVHLAGLLSHADGCWFHPVERHVDCSDD